MEELFVRQPVSRELYLPFLDRGGKCGCLHNHQTFERGKVTFNAMTPFIRRTGSFTVIVLRTKQVPEAV